MKKIERSESSPAAPSEKEEMLSAVSFTREEKKRGKKRARSRCSRKGKGEGRKS